MIETDGEREFGKSVLKMMMMMMMVIRNYHLTKSIWRVCHYYLTIFFVYVIISLHLSGAYTVII